MNGVACSAARAAAGSGRSSRSTPAITSASMSPSAAAARICVVSRPGSGGQGGHSPGPGHLDPRLRAGGQPPAGQQVRQRAHLDGAPLTRPPGYPGQPGPGRPGERSAVLSAPGTSASRSPTRMMAPSAARASLAARPASSSPVAADQAAQGGASPPGTVGSRTPDIRVQPAAGHRGDGVHGQGACAGCLAQPQEDDGGLVVGLEPGQQGPPEPVPGRCS